VPADKPNLLTTGQAAKLCSVTPDAILKWIKKGQLRGVRTAGGHYRIDYRDLQPHIVSPEVVESPSQCVSTRLQRSLHCWEYLSNGGTPKDDCQQCVVYRVRAVRCFLMANLKTDVGHVRQFCRNSCDDCVYFRRATGLPTNVLVLTSDTGLINRLKREQNDGISLRFAQNSYEASAIIHDFRPAFAAIDTERIPTYETELLDSLAADPRLPGLKIILVVPPAMTGWKRRPRKSGEIVGILEKPFGSRPIAALINRLLADLPVPEGSGPQTTAERE
jgi:excisionase family DNA binding protein